MSRNDIRIVPPAGYTGEGRSGGLGRGLLVFSGEINLTGEGMGIGTVALRSGNDTFFSRSWTDIPGEEVFIRVFSIDTRMIWRFQGRSSALLTRLIGTGIALYMKVPHLQDLIISPATRLRVLLGIEPVFERIPLRGNVEFTYHISGLRVDIHMASPMEVNPHETLCLLNELSAAWLTTGWDGTRQVPPPPGWKEVGQEQMPVSLVDPVHGIRFFMERPVVNPPVPYRIYQGREGKGDLCWAGFCIELGPESGSSRFPEVLYTVGVEPGPCL